MGNKLRKKINTRGENQPDVNSSCLIDGELRFTASESTNRIGKAQYDVVIDQTEIDSLLFGRHNESCRVLVLGKSSAGKSAVINALSGEKIAQESHTRETPSRGIEVFRLTMEGKSLVLIESPGLFDGSDREEGHVNDMKDVFKVHAKPKPDSNIFDIALFCFPISTELTDTDKLLFAIYTSTFGKGIWDKMIVLLTFVNGVPAHSPTKFATEIQTKLEGFSSWMKEVLQSNGVTSTAVPIVPTGYMECSILPDGSDWIYELWQKMAIRVDDKVKPILDCFENERFVPFGYISVDETPNQQFVSNSGSIR